MLIDVLNGVLAGLEGEVNACSAGAAQCEGCEKFFSQTACCACYDAGLSFEGEGGEGHEASALKGGCG